MERGGSQEDWGLYERRRMKGGMREGSFKLRFLGDTELRGPGRDQEGGHLFRRSLARKKFRNLLKD